MAAALAIITPSLLPLTKICPDECADAGLMSWKENTIGLLARIVLAATDSP